MRQIRSNGTHVDGAFWAAIQIGGDADHLMTVRGNEVECTCNIATTTEELDHEHLVALQAESRDFVPGLIADFKRNRERRREQSERALLAR